MSGGVDVIVDDGVKILRMNRPEKKNALTNAMYHTLADEMLAANDDDGIGAVLLSSVGDDFSTGNDINDFMATAMGAKAEDTPGVQRFLMAQIDMSKPFVAAVKGLAIGVGATTLFQCDYVVADETAAIRTPFLDLALLPENASSLLATRIMGHQWAFEMLCLGETFDARRGYEARFVNKIATAGEAEADAFGVAKRLAAKPRDAMRIARALLRSDPESVRAVSKKEGALFAERLQSDEARNAFTAFMSRKAG